jgi:hypothetical protein
MLQACDSRIHDAQFSQSRSLARLNVRISPCRSNLVCILTAALCLSGLAHENKDRLKSMVVESDAYKLWSRSIAIRSSAYSGRAMAIKICAKSGQMRQSRDSIASEAHVVEFANERAQAGFDVAKTLAVG